MKIILCTLVLNMIAFTYHDLYYTTDGREQTYIQGNRLSSAMAIVGNARESWVVLAGPYFGPNGYVEPSTSLLSFSKSAMTYEGASPHEILSYGKDDVIMGTLSYDDILYILPSDCNGGPLRAFVRDSEEYVDLYIQRYRCFGVTCDSTQGFNDPAIYVMRLENRGSRAKNFQRAFRARAIAFTDTGIRQAMEALKEEAFRKATSEDGEEE